MQSFGEATLSECMQLGNENRGNSDIEKYFKDNVTFSENPLSNNIKNSKNHEGQSILQPLRRTRNMLKQSESDLEKYFVESIALTNIKVTSQKKVKVSQTCKQKQEHLSKGLVEKGPFKRRQAKIRNVRNVGRKHASNMVSTELLDEDNANKNVVSLNSVREEISQTSCIRIPVLSASHNAENDCHSGISITNSNTSNVCTQDRHKLSSWGLQQNILEKYEARGISSMFAWQVECLSNYKVIEESRNLVYSAPTSAGKTLVSEILLIKTVLERRKKVIFILPFVSVVREKMYYFQDLLADIGIRVEGFMGGQAPVGGFAATNVAIATIEKANSLVNRLMEENELNTLGAVIIDELHMLGDHHRGYLLELLLTKLKYMTLRNNNVNIQLIGMSATLPNLPLLAQWLDAELYKTDFRPVPLHEQCKIGTSIYDNKLNLIREVTQSPDLPKVADDILQLCVETISGGHSVLIFCPTKHWCEKLAQQVAVAFLTIGQKDTSFGKMLREQLDTNAIMETLEQLKRSPTGLDNVLKNTVSFGVAFHHAGLTMDERDIIEGSFRVGSLRVLTATSTLSSGVNLPARRVIIRSPMFGGKLLDTLTYKQMIGRAGRMGKDTAGESILICKPNERQAATSLLSASLEPIQSCLESIEPFIRALLEAVASEVVYTPMDLELYTKCTLVSLTNKENGVDMSKDAIKYLVDNEFLLLQVTGQEQRWVATPLGKACLAASVPPRDALFLFEELQKARRCFVLDTELHVIYLVTPINAGSQIGTIDWIVFLEKWKSISESERRVGQLIGVDERFLMTAVKGIVKPGKLLNIHKRFYTALALHDLVRELPLSMVCRKYGCCRGVLQSLQQSAATFAGMVTHFCKQLGWDCLEILVAQFQTRLQFGVCRELLDLLRLPMLNGLRARSLYKQGITCVADLAVANELDVERALYKALPFESEKEQDGEHETDTAKRTKMRTVFVTGKDGLTPHQAAVMLVQEARELVQNELGLRDMLWEQNDQSSTSMKYLENPNNISKEHENVSTDHDIKQNIHSNEATCPEKELRCSEEHAVDEVVHGSIDEKVDSELQKTYLPLDKIDENIERKSSLDTYHIDNSHSKSVAIHSAIKTQKLRPRQSIMQSCTVEINETENKRRTHARMCTEVSEKRFKDNISNAGLEGQNVTSIQSNSISDTLSFLKSNYLNTKVTSKLEDGSDNIEVPENTKRSMLVNEKVAQLQNSRSPSLFDESFNFDTQACDILEQNIMDSLRISEVEDTNSISLRLSIMTEPKALNASNNSNDVKVPKQCEVKRPSVDTVNVDTTSNPLSWKDDSWNESKVIVKKVNALNTRNNELVKRVSIKNISSINTPKQFDNVKPLNPATPIKDKDAEIPVFKPIRNNFEKLHQLHKFTQLPIEKSPIASVSFFNKRKLSLDSYNSDSDDVIVPSQNTESPIHTIAKTQARSHRQTERNTLKHQLPDPNVPKAESSKDIKQRKKLPKLAEMSSEKLKHKSRDILTRSIGLNSDCSIESVISNSDDEAATKRLRRVLDSTGGSPINDKCLVQYKQVTCNSGASLQPGKTHTDLSKTGNWNTLNIIKVGSDRATFNLFKREVMKKGNVALAVSCEHVEIDTNGIGSKIVTSVTGNRKKKSKNKENYVNGDRKVCGAAISWESNIAYYLSFDNMQESTVSGKEQHTLLKDLLSNKSTYINCFATKDVYKVLYQCCGIAATCNFLDPKIADWLLTGNIFERSFTEMVFDYFPEGAFIVKRSDSHYAKGPGLNVKSSLAGEFRACAEVVLTWHMMNTLLCKLKEMSPALLYTFREVEMRTVSVLACMELSGLGICVKALQDLSSVILEEMVSLQNRAYALAGRAFNLASSKEVGLVLGLYKGRKTSTNKAVLEHCNNPISNIVVAWRKLSSTQTRIVYPLLKLAQDNLRIHGNCVICTVTGRVSMHEPNLQNVPRDFTSEDKSFVISVRMAFTPAAGNILLSADYCQLELRILAHFSKDAILCEIMKKDGDIFKSIAAKWNCVTENQVDDEMRQRTKQLCYAMIYGMGTKSLAESLSVTEENARQFQKSFMDTYPGVNKWLKNVVEQARENGYITTIMERRRVFPGLTSSSLSEKSQAERQAINTKVQGSAADIAKKAMLNIHDRIQYELPSTAMVLSEITNKRKLRSNRGGYLVLQLHDELLYEVNMTDLKQVATIVKESMEQVCQLAVPLPVKIKVGPAWGDLAEYNVSLQ